VALLQTWLRDARNTFSDIDGIMSATYAVLTASFLAAGLGYIVAPMPTLAGVFGVAGSNPSAEALLVWQIIGAGVSMLVGPIGYSLKVRQLAILRRSSCALEEAQKA
jgi:hypothetical protein